jgi:hypothetical protein
MTMSPFKSLPIHPALISTKIFKYHVIINRHGGHAIVNIYYTHYNDSNLSSLIDSVPLRANCSFDAYMEALEFFQQHYFHCLSQEHINFMNANAPLEASNLNNLCPTIKEHIGHDSPSTNNAKEHTWALNISDPTIYALCHAASVRMDKWKLLPTESYNFFYATFTPCSFSISTTALTLSLLLNHNRPTTSTQLNSSQGQQPSHHHPRQSTKCY